MKIPDVPTDNLYKFLAITGLIIFISANGMGLYATINISQQTIKFKSEILDRSLDNTLLHAGAHEDNMDNAVINGYKLFEKRYIDIGRNEHVLLQRKEELDLIMATYSLIKGIYKLLILISVSLMIYGFVNWKYKLQNYQDEILRNEALKSRK
jgi:hypothetical protein